MGPFKCPDCGVWWAGFEHRCRPPETGATANPPWSPGPAPTTATGTYSSPCTCSPVGPFPSQSCPRHGWTIQYTMPTVRS